MRIILRLVLILTISGVAFASRISVSPVIEYKDGRSTIVDRLILRDPSAIEFIVTAVIIAAAAGLDDSVLIRSLLRGYFKVPDERVRQVVNELEHPTRPRQMPTPYQGDSRAVLELDPGRAPLEQDRQRAESPSRRTEVDH